MPLSDLSDPRTEQLLRSPLELVVCQVRHEQNMAAVDPKRALAVRKTLGDLYPVMEEAHGQELTVTAGPEGLQARGAFSGGWRLQSRDRAWAVSIMPEFFSIETSNYQHWDDFKSRVHDLTEAVAKHIEPTLENRLGLRYVNRIVQPEVAAPSEWRRWLDLSLLGLAVSTVFSEHINSSQQVIELAADVDVRVGLRHGFFRDLENDRKWTYVLDYDCFRTRGQEFSALDIDDGLEQLHTLILTCFQASITEEMYDYFRGVGTLDE